MPRISSFYGITIWMYHDEIHHQGRPHFHAHYGDAEASVDNWTRARNHRPLIAIQPLS